MRSYALACEPATVDLPDAFDDGVLKKRKPFNPDHFPLHQQRFRDLLAGGQHSKTLFIGCSDSRIVPHLPGGADPGELIMVRNDGAMVPPCKGSHGLHGTTVATHIDAGPYGGALQSPSLETS